MRKEGNISRTEYADLRDKIQDFRSRARGDSGSQTSGGRSDDRTQSGSTGGFGGSSGSSSGTYGNTDDRRTSTQTSQSGRSSIPAGRQLHQVGLRQLEHRVGDDRREREQRVGAVGPQVDQQPPHQPRVVGLADDVFVVSAHIWRSPVA